MSAETKDTWSYSSGTPDDYVCADCGAKGVRLYRGYDSPRIGLYCTRCVLKNEELSALGINDHSCCGTAAAEGAADHRALAADKSHDGAK